jgi:predicted outer membrane protein
MHASLRNPLAPLGAVILVLCCTGSLAHLTSAERATPPSTADETVTDFLKESISTRLAMLEAARVAQAQSADSSAGAYAKRMTGEESLLLERLQKLATAVGAPQPDQLREKHAKKLEKLQALPPEEFDKEFWEFVAGIYESDLLNFEFASKVSDAEVRAFAVQYRSMFERQLEEIATLRKAAT